MFCSLKDLWQLAALCCVPAASESMRACPCVCDIRVCLTFVCALLHVAAAGGRPRKVDVYKVSHTFCACSVYSNCMSYCCRGAKEVVQGLGLDGFGLYFNPPRLLI